MLVLKLLGPVALHRDGQPLRLTLRKTAALLVLLALGGSQVRGRIAGLLWPALDERTARRNLRRELARLGEIGADDAVAVDGDRLAPAPGLQTDLALALDPAREPSMALAVWGGPLADGLELDDAPAFMAWLAGERERLHRRWQERLADAAAAAEAGGDGASALAAIDRLLDDDPLQERHHRHALRLLGTAGRREEALARHRRFRELLQAELGLVPMAETEALVAGLTAEAPAPVAAEVPMPSPAAAPARLPEQLPFVGREAEVAALQRAWVAGSTILVEGEGGVGKSRLVLDFAAAQGPFAQLRCRAGDAEQPLSTLTRLLAALAGPDPAADGLPDWVVAELARVLPSLGAAPPPMRDPEERTRFAQACLAAWQAWAEGSFDAVVVDDWHLADADSRRLLATMGEEGTVRRIWAYRPDLRPEAAALVERLQAAGAAHLRLEPLEPQALYALVQRLSGAAQPQRFAVMLARATGGLPFYVAETLRHLVETGWLHADETGRWSTPVDASTEDYRELPLPASVRDAVLARVRRLPDAPRRVLEAAALAGEPFAATLLAPACALGEVEAELALEAATEAHLLRALEGDGYAFAHDLVPAALDAALDPARRRSVHRRLALGAAAAGAPPARVAMHHEAAGEPARAVVWRQRAGDDAMRRLAPDEAVAQWQRALDDGAAGDVALEIACARLRTLAELDREDEAQQVWAGILAQIEAGAGSAASCTRARLALARHCSAHERGDAALKQLEAIPPQSEPALEAETLLVRGQALRAAGRLDEATQYTRSALEHPALDPALRFVALDNWQLLLFMQGRYAEAVELNDRAQDDARAGGDAFAQARVLGRRASFLCEMGDLSAAEPAMRGAADAFGRLGMTAMQRNILFNFCVLYSSAGRPDAVLRSAEEAWALKPPPPLGVVRMLLQLAFVEAHGALGHLGECRRRALAALDDAVALGATLELAYLQTAVEPLAWTGDGAALAPVLAALPEVRKSVPVLAVELLANLAEAALLDDDPDLARHYRAQWQALPPAQPGRLAVRVGLADAAVRLADGDAAGAQTLLPADDAAGLNDELRLRTLALRLRILAAQGDTAALRAAAAEAERRLAAPVPHALAALVLHDALRRAAPSPARIRAWRQRLDGLAATLADAPAAQAALLRRA